MVESMRSFELDPKKDRSGGKSKKSAYAWNLNDVLRWLEKNHHSHFISYGELFRTNEIIGKVLVQLTELQLEQMGISNEEHRADLVESILRLRLKNDQTELKLLRKTPQTPKST